jgi:hypothetical protein
LIEKGVRFQEIAGNLLIALTVKAPRDWVLDPQDGEKFLEWNILRDPATKRVAIAVPVNQLHQTLLNFAQQKIQLDHIYDY